MFVVKYCKINICFRVCLICECFGYYVLVDYFLKLVIKRLLVVDKMDKLMKVIVFLWIKKKMKVKRFKVI